MNFIVYIRTMKFWGVLWVSQFGWHLEGTEDYGACKSIYPSYELILFLFLPCLDQFLFFKSLDYIYIHFTNMSETTICTTFQVSN